ncbi:hypothetical protein G9464_00615 [Halostella sp. JP-L12]|uniref:DUF5784 family protein n=1 Tax=Halostella TaxID=1843185 RepID=UPI000EF7C26E|nr:MULTISPECIES: DUF5784 family protein [Halostella]NHN46100.1 hypothetical protein [Halostella sp. JP-L12]
MARPLRFRRSPERWTASRVHDQLFTDLDQNLGATSVDPRFRPAGDWETRRFEMDNGDLALFIWDDDAAYWMGNTETPSALWRTDKFGWGEVPYQVARWCQRELLAELHEGSPWLEPYPHLSWFFLPVFMSKDGRHTTREFFRNHAAGFPDADRDDGLGFYERFLSTGVLDDHRDEMAGKLGTSEQFDLVRMSSAMAEFTAAKLLTDAGYEVTPEIEVTTGHSLDFRAARDDHHSLVEVTRPRPPTQRAASTAVAAVRETAETKTSGQLSEHGGGAVFFVDCSSFRDDQWLAVRGEQPEVRHRPAVVYRVRPDGHAEGYSKGSVPIDLDGVIEWV